MSCLLVVDEADARDGELPCAQMPGSFLRQHAAPGFDIFCAHSITVLSRRCARQDTVTQFLIVNWSLNFILLLKSSGSKEAEKCRCSLSRD